jgi:hypothetical protein
MERIAHFTSSNVAEITYSQRFSHQRLLLSAVGAGAGFFLGISSDKDSLAGIVPGGARFDCCAITSARALVNIWRDDNRRYTVLFGQGQGFRDSQRLECLMSSSAI